MPNAALMSDSAQTRRFRPRALPTLVTIAAVLLFVAAGQWQQRRMHEKEALRAQFDAAAALPSVELAAEAGRADWNGLRYRNVAASGRYDARHQILLDNRVHDGHAGYHVITPLVLIDGRTVLVNRGWAPQGRSRSELPRVAPPAGAVTVQGRLAIPPASAFELAKDSASGPVWQNLDLARFSAATGIGVLPVIIEASDTASGPSPGDGLVRDWPPPDFGVEKHEIYMVQWYAFAVLAIALWAVLNLRRGVSAHE
jgi:surfeit locus 1 family protein